MGALHRAQWPVRDPLLMTGTSTPSTPFFLQAASVACMLGAPAVLYKSVAAENRSCARLAFTVFTGLIVSPPRSAPPSVPMMQSCFAARCFCPPAYTGVFACMPHNNKGFPKDIYRIALPSQRPSAAGWRNFFYLPYYLLRSTAIGESPPCIDYGVLLLGNIPS